MTTDKMAKIKSKMQVGDETFAEIHDALAPQMAKVRDEKKLSLCSASASWRRSGS